VVRCRRTACDNRAAHPFAGPTQQPLLKAGQMHPFETIYTDSMEVACNGGGGPLGHPKVYLNLSAEGQVECPYCSRLFIHQSKRTGDKPHEGPEHGIAATTGAAKS
jgi:uncharacterized Zn-finger protein